MLVVYVVRICQYTREVMEYSSKINRVTHSNSKGGKEVLRQQQQAAGQVFALIRVTKSVECLEEHIKVLMTPTPVFCPPQHVIDLATAIRDSTARTKGTIVTF